MAPASQLNAKPGRKKAAGKQKKQLIDSNEEARKNASIELELDEELEEMISNGDDLSDGEEAINAGFSTPRTTYSTPVSEPQITHKSPFRLRSQGLKRPPQTGLWSASLHWADPITTTLTDFAPGLYRIGSGGFWRWGVGSRSPTPILGMLVGDNLAAVGLQLDGLQSAYFSPPLPAPLEPGRAPDRYYLPGSTYVSVRSHM